MKSILCLLVVVAICGITHAGELDGISKVTGGKADADCDTNNKKAKSNPSNPIGDMFSPLVKAPVDMADKFTEGFMEGIGKNKNDEKTKDSKTSGAKKEN